MTISTIFDLRIPVVKDVIYGSFISFFFNLWIIDTFDTHLSKLIEGQNSLFSLTVRFKWMYRKRGGNLQIVKDFATAFHQLLHVHIRSCACSVTLILW